jgi:predicted nucleic-acid-binding protein
MIELAWVLERNTAELRIEDHSEVRSAIALFEAGADFADALLGELNRKDGCSTTITFDRSAAKRLSALSLLEER